METDEKHTAVKRDNQQSSSHEQNITNQPKFLRLPTEIRLEIYKYLVPRGLVRLQYDGNLGMRFIAHDNCNWTVQEFSTAILRVNKQIYYEIIDLWFGIGRYCLTVYLKADVIMVTRTISILNRTPIAFSNLQRTLPKWFRFFRNLRITICPDYWFISEPVTEAIVKVLLSQACHLKECGIYVEIPKRVPGYCIALEDDIYAWFYSRFEWNLLPLHRLITKNVKVRIHYCTMLRLSDCIRRDDHDPHTSEMDRKIAADMKAACKDVCTDLRLEYHEWGYNYCGDARISMRNY